MCAFCIFTGCIHFDKISDYKNISNIILEWMKKGKMT